MKSSGSNSERQFEDLLQSIRRETPDAGSAEKATHRVWEDLSVREAASRTRMRKLRTCDDFQALASSDLDGSLSPARRLLLEDHLRECVVCRRVFKEAPSADSSRPAPAPAQGGAWWKWAGVAATLLLAIGLSQTGVPRLFLVDDSAEASVLEQVSGDIYGLAEHPAPLQSGGTVAYGQPVRTTNGSTALLRLNDGSVIEMGERAELSVHRGWSGTNIRLERGQIIVQAAPQGSGRLSVSTNDCRVTVQGTVFSVNHGLKGSRVSVLEGTVSVEQSGKQTLLRAGEQYSSRSRVARVAVEREVSWSRNAAKHLSLIREFSTLGKELQKATFGEQARFSSRLLPYIPDGTFVYGAFPNVSMALDEAYQLVVDRIEASPELRGWYEENAADGNEEIRQLFERIRSIGDQVGEEVVIAVSRVPPEHPRPLILAEVRHQSALRAVLEREAASLNAESLPGPVIRILDDPSEADSSPAELFIFIAPEVMIASPSPELLQEVAANIRATPSDAEASRVEEQLMHAYEEGVDWLFFMDVDQVRKLERPLSENGESASLLETFGIGRPQDLIVHRKRISGITESRAKLTFADSDGGIISWLGSPGPMGALDFVSPEAHMAAAFVVSNPAELVDELLRYLQASEYSLGQEFLAFQQEHGIDVRSDIAAPLGGEFVFALDGPVLPAPSWIVVLEVYDAVRLQDTIERIVTEINQAAVENGKPGFLLESSPVADRTLYSIRRGDSGLTVQYVYIDGYLVAAPNQSLIWQAIQYHQSGYTLVNTTDFTSLLPADAGLNLSGVFYNNLGPLLQPILAGELSESIGGESAVRELIADSGPAIVGLYSRPGEITVATSGDLESLWLNVGLLASLRND